MDIYVWPTKNSYFKVGIDEIVLKINVSVNIDYKQIVFIDFSKWNIKDILTGSFLCLLSEDATLIFYCEDNMLPFGLYYLSIVNKSFVFTKKDKLLDVINKLNTPYLKKKIEAHHLLTTNEFLLMKDIITRGEDIQNIAKIRSENIKTIYSRYYMVLKKTKVRKINEFIC